MPLAVAQTTALFEYLAQMGIRHATVIQLQEEGIETVDDLAEFDKDTIEQVAANLRRPAGRIPDPSPAAAPGSTVPTPPFVLGAKAQKHMIVATNLVKSYQTVGHPLTASNISWTTPMANFDEQWKALKAKKEGGAAEVPKISKALPVIRWTEAFRDHLHRTIGVRTIPLAYIIRTDDDVPAITAIANGHPHSTLHGSIEDELIARATHTHPLYREDNQAVYSSSKRRHDRHHTKHPSSPSNVQRTEGGLGFLCQPNICG
jgi:hypothetical protein